jgi:acid phosphatase type 7
MRNEKQALMKHPLLFLFLLVCLVKTTAQTLLVQPFLQDAEPTSIVIAWEAFDATAGMVEWGLTTALGSATISESEVGLANSRIHHAHIMGLLPDTRYYYRVSVGTAQSSTFDFITPPLKDSEKSFALVAMSDMQRDGSNPNVYEEICNDGVIAYLNGDIVEKLAFAMLPGDLVDNGNDYQSWKTTFFDPSQNLFRHVPVYPAIGNHEANSPTYFKYFELPDNGTTGYEEHWWYKDYSNLRIIGLNSNGGYTIAAQLDWLETVLAEAAADPDIDFVFAQLHHPHHSELWPAGNSNYTGEVIKKLEAFTAASGKPSLHFYGHTHGYSRGQSQDYNHSMVNVATAGGNIDYWNEFPNTDYPEHTVSQDEYGFVWVDVQAGAAPQFLLKRISRGNEQTALDNVLRDSFLIKRYNQQPATPAGTFPTEGMVVSPDCPLELSATAYSDPDGDLHGASQWQVSNDPSFASTTVDSWRQYENWYNNMDLQAGDDLTDELVDGLEENTTYFWRVRYRDRSLGWSEWSEPISFQTTEAVSTDNLLLNGGAEDGLTGWTTVTGIVESILSGECQGNLAYAGDRLFAVGGVCIESAYGEAHQNVDVSGFASQIAGGTVKAKFGGFLSDYLGTDLPEFRLDFLNASGDSISSTPTYGIHSGSWVQFRETADVPADCAQIRFVLMGTRESGTDNDSYFDEMFLKLDTAGCASIALPTASFTAAGNFGCAPLTVYFHNLSENATEYVWEFPGGAPLTSTEENPTVVYNDAGIYDVYLAAINAQDADIVSEFGYIVVIDVPSPSFTSTTNANMVNFMNTTGGGGASYVWNFGDGSPTSMVPTPTHTYAVGGIYEVTLTATNNCGSDSTTIEVTVGANSTGDMPGISRFEVFPNPNDGSFTLVMEGTPQTGLLGLSFFNVLGQCQYQGTADFRMGYLLKEFSFSSLATGVYTLQVKSGDRVMFKRVVVE